MDVNHPLPQRAIITGVSSGIGKAVATHLLAAGSTVVGIDREPCEWSLPNFFPHQADITDPLEVDTVFAAASDVLGGHPDAVIHCAGVYRWAPLRETGISDWERVMGVNATGTFLVAQAAARVISRGAIVLLTSVAYARGDEGEPGIAYSASKGAVVSLTTQLAAELGPRGIRVNAVAPGMIDTPMLTLGETPGAIEALTARLPARRLGTAEDVAAACVFLASSAADYITGVTLPVDGGYLAS